MKRVTGIGGVFFKAANPAALQEWYRRHLGLPIEAWGGCGFRWQGDHNPDGHGTTVWSLFNPDSNYLGTSPRGFMVNYRVEDLRALVAVLRDEGCDVDDKIEESEHGVFGWVTDPEGNRIELWQPPPGQ